MEIGCPNLSHAACIIIIVKLYCAIHLSTRLNSEVLVPMIRVRKKSLTYLHICAFIKVCSISIFALTSRYLSIDDQIVHKQGIYEWEYVQTCFVLQNRLSSSETVAERLRLFSCHQAHGLSQFLSIPFPIRLSSIST